MKHNRNSSQRDGSSSRQASSLKSGGRQESWSAREFSPQFKAFEEEQPQGSSVFPDPPAGPTSQHPEPIPTAEILLHNTEGADPNIPHDPSHSFAEGEVVGVPIDESSPPPHLHAGLDSSPHPRPPPLRDIRSSSTTSLTPHPSRARRHSEVSAGLTSTITTYSNGGIISQGRDQLDKDKNVMFRLINKNTDGRKCQASYTTMDPFKPDADTLLRTTVFSQFISITDFSVLVEFVNATMDGYRSKSLGVVFGFLLLSFVCLMLAIFVHPALGVTAQVFAVIIHSAVQKAVKTHCVDLLNKSFAEDVNEPLIVTRGVYCKMQMEGDGCFASWFELDFCQLPGAESILRQHQADAAAIVEDEKDQRGRSNRSASTSERRGTTGAAFGFGDPCTEDPRKALNELRKTVPALKLPRGNPLQRSSTNIHVIQSPVRKVQHPAPSANSVPQPSTPSGLQNQKSVSFSDRSASVHDDSPNPLRKQQSLSAAYPPSNHDGAAPPRHGGGSSLKKSHPSSIRFESMAHDTAHKNHASYPPAKQKAAQQSKDFEIV